MPQKFDIKFDVRILDRNIKEGVITEKQYGEFLNGLDDTSENATPIETLSVEENEDTEEVNESESEETESSEA